MYCYTTIFCTEKTTPNMSKTTTRKDKIARGLKFKPTLRAHSKAAPRAHSNAAMRADFKAAPHA